MKQNKKLPKGSAALPLSGQFRTPLQCSEFPASPQRSQATSVDNFLPAAFKVHAEYNLYLLLAFLIHKKLSPRLQSLQGRNKQF